MKFPDSIKNHFTFTIKEQRGIWMLSVLILILILVRTGMTYFKSSSAFDFSGFDEKVKLLESFTQDTIHQDSARTIRPGSVQKPFRPNSGIGFIAGSASGKKKTESMQIIELNTADSLSLVMLKGIGPVLTTRIIKYRERLGGFYDVNQLAEVYGMDTLTFVALKPLLTTDAMLIRTIDLNNASFKALLYHPYLEYDDVKMIVKYRDKAGSFKSLEELYHIEGLDTSLIKRIIPYFEICQQSK